MRIRRTRPISQYFHDTIEEKTNEVVGVRFLKIVEALNCIVYFIDAPSIVSAPCELLNQFEEKVHHIAQIRGNVRYRKLRDISLTVVM